MNKLVILSLMVSMSLSALAAIGYVDSHEVFQNYSKTKAYKEVLEKNKVEVEKKLDAENTALKNRQEAIVKKGAKATAKEKADLQKDIEVFQKKLFSEQEKYQNEDVAKATEIRKDIRNTINDISKADKYDAVVDASTIISGGVDLTSKVSEALEKNYKK